MVSSTKPDPYKDGYMECVSQLAQLRAENERLQKLGGGLVRDNSELTQMLNELRAVNKVLQLRGDTYLEQLQQKHAENERLRAALEKIEAGYGQRLSAAELASIARQAL